MGIGAANQDALAGAGTTKEASSVHSGIVAAAGVVQVGGHGIGTSEHRHDGVVGTLTPPVAAAV